jgi:hypothetical protein
MNKHISLVAFTSLLSLTACGDDVNTPVTVVTQANYTYVFQDSAGKEIATQTTLKAGEITQVVPAGSMVTAYSSESSDDVTIRTITELNPGDRIDLDPELPATTTHNVKLPVGFATAQTRVSAWCDGNEEVGFSPINDVVSIYFACAKPTFTAVTPGPPPKLLYKKDVGADATGMFDLSEESLRAVKDVAITYTGIPKEIALGALEVDTLIGDVTIGNINEDILLNTQNANGLVMAKAAEINSNGALASKLTLVRTDDRGPMQIAITGHKSAPYSIDADALMLPWVESATFGLVDKKISWTTTSGGKGNPDGVLVGLALLRGTQTIKWSIIGSFTGNEMKLPGLPTGNPLNLTSADTIVVENVGLLSAPGGYETFKTVPTSKFSTIISSGGSIVYSALNGE